RSAPPAVPPPEVKRAILSRITPAAPALPRRERGRGWIPWIVGAAAAAIVVAAFTGAFVARHYEARLGQMAHELAETRERLQRDGPRASSGWTPRGKRLTAWSRWRAASL